MTVGRTWMIGAVVLALALAGLSSNAAASQMTVSQAVKTELKAIEANPAFKTLKTFKINTVAKAKKAIPKLEQLKALYASAATVVGQSSATTRGQKTARTDWVTGVRAGAKGVGDLAAALLELIAGNKTTAQTYLDKGLKLVASGSLLSTRAEKLLGLVASAERSS